MNRDIFAKRLKELRMSRQMTLQNVGDIVGCNRQNVSNLENGRVSPSLAVVLALADYFGVSADYLVGRSSSPTKTSLDDGEEPREMYALDPEREKLMRVIEALNSENADRVYGYAMYLRYVQRLEDRKKKRHACQ